MTGRALLFAILAAAFSATASYFCAVYAVAVLERETIASVNTSLHAAGTDWARVRADGLRVVLTGEAPSERARFSALEVTGRVIDTGRIDDQITVASATAEVIPEFELTIARNGGKLSLIGLVPNDDTRATALGQLSAADYGDNLSDLMEPVSYDPPQGWSGALNLALTAATRLERAQIIVRPGRVEISAFLPSVSEKAAIETALAEVPQDGLDVILDLAAPKPVVAPFVFAAQKSETGVAVTACTANTDAAHTAITARLRDLSGDSAPEGAETCAIALGTPSPDWQAAVIASLDALDTLGTGAVEISDADITLTGPVGGDQDAFDAAMVALDADLPRIFSLEAVLPPPPATDTSMPPPPRIVFSANLDPENGVTLNGPLRDKMATDAVRNYASALFGFAAVTDDMSENSATAAGWTKRVLTALEALGMLHEGQIFVTEDTLKINGITIEEGADESLLAFLNEHLGGSDITHEITFKPEIKRLIEAPNPEECEMKLVALLNGAQIVFAPNSADISGESGLLLDQIAEIILSCPNAQFEIGGHTDSQGREAMNLALSQSRAEAVLDSLLARGVLLQYVDARGYGESEPIASNDDEAGRATNRRIEFKLLSPETAVEEDETNEQN